MPQPDHPTVRQRRQALGLSLRQFAALSGLHFRQLWSIENGQRPRADELKKLANAFRCSPDDLKSEWGL